MRELYNNPMRTSFDVLDENQKIIHKGDRTSCFMSAHGWLFNGKDFDNTKARYVKYYPWILPDIIKDEPEYLNAVEAYLDVLFSIPFVKERVQDYTGYSHSDGRKINKENYFLVDMKVPIDEGFSILQILRLPQEFPGRIKTFYDTVKSTGCERTAFLAALMYENSAGTPLFGGHNPSNGISIEWAKEFIKNPGHAKSVDNAWNSDVMGGGEGRAALHYEDFVAHLTGGDPCTIPVAVYGSLRKGLGNHRLLENARKENGARFYRTLGASVPCKMYSLGGFPALVPSIDNNRIVFEIYHVNERTLKSLDGLEGYPSFYDRTQILMNEQLCWVYFQHKAPSDKVVNNGDWVDYISKVRRTM